MKVYAIKVGDRYISQKHQAFEWRYWNSSATLETTTDISEARHYNIKSQAKNYTRNLYSRIRGVCDKIQVNISKNNPTGYYIKQQAACLDVITKDILPMLDIAEIVEHEVEGVEDTNLHEVKRKRLEFNPWVVRHERTKGIKIHTETTKRHHCKCCGVYLKDIPQVNFNGIYGGVICCRCAIRVGQEAQQVWDALPNKEDLEKDFFLANI